MGWHGYWDGGLASGYWWVWLLGWVLVLVSLLVFGVWAVWTLAGRRSGTDSALAVLQRRLAAGEISQEDFDRTRRAIQP